MASKAHIPILLDCYQQNGEILRTQWFLQILNNVADGGYLAFASIHVHI